MISNDIPCRTERGDVWLIGRSDQCSRDTT